MSMHIAGMEVNYPCKALEIFVSGCTRNCPGCHNPELQKYGVGKKWQRWVRDNGYKLKYEWSLLADKIWIVGGDLLCQPPEDAVEFIKALRRIVGEEIDICIWTGEDYWPGIDPDIFDLVDVFKLGSYREDLPPVKTVYKDRGGVEIPVTLASNNQYFLYTNPPREDDMGGE